jgi:hypothetical protein
VDDAMPTAIERPGVSAADFFWLAALAPIAVFMPSSSRRADLAKLTLLSAMVAGFFLFTGKIWLPGGGNQFIDYAEAIVHGTNLPPEIAQRDAGYPLLIILSGYTFLGSIIPIILIQASFAIAMPLLIYESLRRLSAPVAFYCSLLSIVTLGPTDFMKMLHHDQAYIFFSTLMIYCVLALVQTRRYCFIYLFTAAAIAASVTRPAGNVLFPVFLIVSYLTIRGNIRYYLTCAAVFATAISLYGWHRYVIFDMQHTHSTPSYTGEQVFYNPYLASFDYGIQLSSKDVGPNLTVAVDHLRELLQSNVKDSEFIKKEIVNYYSEGAGRDFAQANILLFTPDQLIDQVLASPNWEYYLLLCDSNDDRVMLRAASEIAHAYPDLMIRYFFRNLSHFVFRPGYAHTRYNLNPFGSIGLAFHPADEYADPHEVMKLAARGDRAAREAQFNPLLQQPTVVRKLFYIVHQVWLRLYFGAVGVTGALMCVAWATAIAGLANILRSRRLRLAPQTEPWPSKALAFADDRFVVCVFIASLLFGYNAVVTAAFAEPNFRYHEMVELQTILIAGFGLISSRQMAKGILAPSIDLKGNPTVMRVRRLLRAFDIFERFTAFQIASVTTFVVLALFAWWAIFMLQNTAA